MSAPPIDVAASLQAVQTRVRVAEALAGRPPGSVQLLAVSKTKPAESVRAALAAGQHDFGENYLDDALTKIQILQDEPVHWHFIGAIQSNKTASIATHFDWAQSIERVKIARRLSDQRPADKPPLNVLLQVNIDREPQKAGVDPDELDALAAQVDALPNLVLRGLMAIPAPVEDPDAQRVPLARLREYFEAMQPTFPTMDTLSMGMSDDLEAAVAEGSTLVRIGTAIFGARH